MRQWPVVRSAGNELVVRKSSVPPTRSFGPTYLLFGPIDLLCGASCLVYYYCYYYYFYYYYCYYYY
jgi:hypothetical protein